MPYSSRFIVVFLLSACGGGGGQESESAASTSLGPASSGGDTDTTAAPTTSTTDEVTSTGGTSTGGTSTGATSTGDTTSTTDAASTTASTTDTTSTDDGSSSGTTTDQTTGAPVDACKAQDDDAVGVCVRQGAPDSFEPVLQWAWTGPEPYSVVIPLVANLTDDNADGAIDLCDVPDVVVVASQTSDGSEIGHIYVLDGATGALHFQIEDPVNPEATPAIGDIDGDGLPEIVTGILGGPLIAFEHDGAKKWQGQGSWGWDPCGSVALADADNDGDVEILVGKRLYDHKGVTIEEMPDPVGICSASLFADLDGDGDLEIVLGSSAYHHDGKPHYVDAASPGLPAIANLDADPEPEIVVTNTLGLTLLDHDGTAHYKNLRPTGESTFNLNWHRPVTIDDFDGDGAAEYAMSSSKNFTVYAPQGPVIVWKATVSDVSGAAGGTAFDFLGDGVPEAMYADEKFLFAFGDAGQQLMKHPHSSITAVEYPVVADVDNDGSAEIVVVSSFYINQAPPPTVQVFRDKDDRWAQARRIWNQHTYHVTNVREDGTIPQFEQPSWQHLNTFRTNARIEDGVVCEP